MTSLQTSSSSNRTGCEEYDLPTLKTIDSIADRGDLKAAWFKDSEGNMIAHLFPMIRAAAERPNPTGT